MMRAAEGASGVRGELPVKWIHGHRDNKDARGGDAARQQRKPDASPCKPPVLTRLCTVTEQH